MVFNWFRRKFDQSESEPVPEIEQVEESAVEEEEIIAGAEAATVSEEVASSNRNQHLW
jgi:hypothetical protein